MENSQQVRVDDYNIIPSEVQMQMFFFVYLFNRHGIKDQLSENPRILRPGDTDNIRKCIVSGLFPNAAFLHMSGTFRTVRGDREVSIHPTSTLYSTTQPSWLVFAELVHTNKLLMRDVTVIDPAWLEILAPHYYEKITLRT